MKSTLFFLLIVSLCYEVKCVNILNDIASFVSKYINHFKQFLNARIDNVSKTMKDLFSNTLPHKPNIANNLNTSKPVKLNVKSIKATPKSNISKKITHITTPMLAQLHGIQMETHTVITKDGYYLTVHRIPAITNPRNRTVLIHHGLLGSSMDWILLRPNGHNTLPYLLANFGYDVWLINARGNRYCQKHQTLTVNMPAFWNFTFHEMGVIDLPAVVDYMIERKVSLPIDFVGHSMGSSAFLVFMSSNLNYKRFVRMGVLIAPLAFMRRVRGPLKKLSKVSTNVMKSMSTGEFLPDRKVPSWLARKHCSGFLIFCNNPLLFLSGMPAYENWTPRFIARFRDNVPAGGSIKTIAHYIQLARSGNFNTFNNVSDQYNLKGIETPLALISSNDDILASVADVQKIYYTVKNPIDHFVIKIKNVSHTDFLWDSRTATVVIRKTLQYLERGLNRNMMQDNEV